ncbi:MAG: phenylacetate--CoA ligase, partial [Christensenellaceae bacterium]|nr:phenylacetate--CoA ligase [Christensenellaceae bacterium]
MSNYFNKAAECMTLAEKKALQSEKLIKIVKYVYEAQKPYREKMDDIKLKPSDIKSIDDLYKLPFTEKKDLRNSYPFGMFAAPMRDITRIHASSGTTGKLTVAGSTAKDIAVWGECCARAIVAAGGSVEDIVHVCYGYGLFTGGLGLHYGAEALGATCIPASSGNTDKQLTLIKDFGATIIACTPSYAVHIAEEFAKSGSDGKQELQLRLGSVGAAPGTEALRR